VRILHIHLCSHLITDVFCHPCKEIHKLLKWNKPIYVQMLIKPKYQAYYCSFQNKSIIYHLHSLMSRVSLHSKVLLGNQKCLWVSKLFLYSPNIGHQSDIPQLCMKLQIGLCWCPFGSLAKCLGLTKSFSTENVFVCLLFMLHILGTSMLHIDKGFIWSTNLFQFGLTCKM
jgi:hypothetical protein